MLGQAVPTLTHTYSRLKLVVCRHKRVDSTAQSLPERAILGRAMQPASRCVVALASIFRLFLETCRPGCTTVPAWPT